MSQSNYALLQTAILTLTPVQLTYETFIRQVCPHSLGTMRGIQKLLVYQFAGGSHKGLSPDGSPNNWRCMFLGDVSAITLAPGAWHTATDHNQPNT